MQYASKRRALRLIMKPIDRTIDENRRATIIPGKRAEFIEYMFRTDDPELIEWLHIHPSNGSEFFEVNEAPNEALAIQRNLERLKLATQPVVVQGAKSTGDKPAGYVEDQRTITPETTNAISPSLEELIDKKISSALGEIMSILKAGQEKEAKVKENKPLKSFKCPYCGDAFPSGFAVGDHKKICDKKS